MAPPSLSIKKGKETISGHSAGRLPISMSQKESIERERAKAIQRWAVMVSVRFSALNFSGRYREMKAAKEALQTPAE